MHNLPADLLEAKDLLLNRALTQGVSVAGWNLGTCKIFLGSLGIDWTAEQNRRVFLELVRSGVLSFARADLVDEANKALVEASAVRDGVSIWHYLVLSA